MAERTTVVLVDETGRELGTAAKRDAHEPPGQLHLAFSVFLFTPDRRLLLLQQRARTKYHFPGIWANTCCSHPARGEDLLESAAARLEEELGLVADGALADLGSFVYRAVDPVSGLVEHELDHVVVGTIAVPNGVGPAAPPDPPPPDPTEVEAMRWVSPAEVRGHGPEQGFAPWFATALDIALA